MSNAPEPRGECNIIAATGVIGLLARKTDGPEPID
jgi:hypothetical protein